MEGLITDITCGIGFWKGMTVVSMALEVVLVIAEVSGCGLGIDQGT